MRFKTLDHLEPAGKRVLVRVDLNVPVKHGRVTDTTRIERAVPTIRELRERGGRVVLLSHFGRPKGKRDPGLSLRPVVPALAEALGGAEVAFAEDCIGAEAERVVAALPDGGVALLENLRFHPGEESDDTGFARELAALGDLYVNDAFSAAHRAHASVSALARLLPAAAGRLMQEELQHLERVLETPERPLVAITGGAKVSTKFELIGSLTAKVDVLAIGGGMANTFLAALGHEVGTSLCERDAGEAARDALERAKARSCEVVLPVDVVVAERLAEGGDNQVVPADRVPADRMILDLGPETAERISRRLEQARSLVWNGPLGCFETPPFDAATNAVARKAAELTQAGRLLSVAGGGDTVAALAHAGVLQRFSYVSSAGGAFLEWLEGKPLPGIAALEEAAAGQAGAGRRG